MKEKFDLFSYPILNVYCYYDGPLIFSSGDFVRNEFYFAYSLGPYKWLITPINAEMKEKIENKEKGILELITQENTFLWNEETNEVQLKFEWFGHYRLPIENFMILENQNWTTFNMSN